MDASEFVRQLIKQAGIVDQVGTGLKAYGGPMAKAVNSIGSKLSPPAVSGSPDARILQKFQNRAYFPANGGNAGAMPYGNSMLLGGGMGFDDATQNPVLPFHPGPWSQGPADGTPNNIGDYQHDLNSVTHAVPSFGVRQR